MSTAPTLPRTTTPSPDGRWAPTPAGLLRRVGADSAYLLTGFPLALAGFVVLVTGAATGAGLLVVWVGLPLLVATALATRALAELERARIAAVVPAPRLVGAYGPVPAGTGLVRRFLAPLLREQTRRDALHALALFPVSVVTWSVAVAWWSTAVAGTGSVLWARWARADGGPLVLLDLPGMPADPGARVVAATVVGLAFLLTLPAVLRTCTRVQTDLGRALLG
ncbi:sensor domain-containing protein [Kineococcus glutinatus]|uniref:Putative sensor domain-containing protein n=1 Tax=Kineococcus glutinatus TaxID=1070872 RepID=A0ABP9I955_9ACTN